ncbi:hypothetical protein CGLO_01685 [Colletotrichum gloeosporioides Cg-14]|uniref:Nephrocystin 3-like N-terminal domain-containing protein n=1 Tax=Colletotrichum gloeosporioides (strain Cg-14) TaxID=1237896 RepID=T0KRE3_COLGC|nr:hypothetical protein CGLO_01685 [Colletotrichum gloeosporioides Cg-14]
MAESLAALGVAASIVQLVELGLKITKSVVETYCTTDVDGLAQRNVDLVEITNSLKDRCMILKSDAEVKADLVTMGLLKRCIRVADELLSELEGLKMSNAKRQRNWNKLVMSVKAYLRKSKIDDLRGRLVDIKKEIFERLVVLLYDHRKTLSEAMRSLGEASLAWNNATEKRLDSMARDLQRLLEETFGWDEAQNRGIIRAILKSLHFAQIKERQNEIPQAHRNTFEWIFEESSPDSFSSWLRHSDGGVFWVTGKPGSGKSTLMKLILGHQTTSTLAGAWAESKPLIIASHFFWSVGTKLQKSQEGLLRTLLFQILVQCPEVIPQICVERYLDHFRSLESWGVEELSNAFERIQVIQQLPCRILVLVDGLDEYSGELKELTRFLHAIASSPDIKVCCASRPWPHFVRAFNTSPWKVEMHLLTKDDILRYTEDNLRENANFRNIEQSEKSAASGFIQEIVSKSEGVFFWVSLVIKSLLRGLENFDTIGVLQSRLFELPSDLHHFFQRMLDSIEDTYCEYTFTIFTILLTAKASVPLRVFRDLTLQSLRQKMDTMNLKKPTRTYLGLGVKTPKDWELLWEPASPMNDLERERILGRCRDLVQACGVESHDDRIGFLHRTVFEFLQESPSLQKFIAQLPEGPYYLLAFAFRLDMCVTEDRHDLEDSLMRMCYFIQELEIDRIATGKPLWDILYHTRQVFFAHSQSTSLLLSKGEAHRMLGHAQARALLLFQPPAPGTKMNRHHVEVVADILKGSVLVSVAEDSQIIWSDWIDLGLLDDILDFYEANFINYRPMFDFMWQTFIARIANPKLGFKPPLNTIQACKIFAEHGAQGSFVVLSNVTAMFPEMGIVRDKAPASFKIDVVDILKQCGRLGGPQLDELEDLLPKSAQRALPAFDHVWAWISKFSGIKKG